MDDPSPHADGDETGVEPDRESATGTPRWVYVFGGVAVVMVLLFVLLHLTGRGLGGHAP